MKPPQILVVLAGGLVQDVITAQPSTYMVIDLDVEGTTDDERCNVPQELAVEVRADEMFRPRHIIPTISSEAALHAAKAVRDWAVHEDHGK